MGKFRGDFRGVVRVVFLTYQIFMIFKMEGEKIMKNEKVKSELMKVWQSVELLESVMAEFEKNGKAIDYEVCKKSVLLQRDALAEIEYMIETEEED